MHLRNQKQLPAWTTPRSAQCFGISSWFLRWQHHINTYQIISIPILAPERINSTHPCLRRFLYLHANTKASNRVDDLLSFVPFCRKTVAFPVFYAFQLPETMLCHAMSCYVQCFCVSFEVWTKTWQQYKTNISQRASVILAHSQPGCVCPALLIIPLFAPKTSSCSLRTALETRSKLWTFGKRQVTSLKKAAFVSICKLPVYCIILSDRCFQITTREDGGQALSRAFVCLMLVIGTKAWFTWQNQKPSHRKSQHLSLEYNPMGTCVTVWPEPIHEFSRNVQCSLSTDTTCNTCFTLGGYLRGLNL